MPSLHLIWWAESNNFKIDKVFKRIYSPFLSELLHFFLICRLIVFIQCQELLKYDLRKKSRVFGSSRCATAANSMHSILVRSYHVQNPLKSLLWSNKKIIISEGSSESPLFINRHFNSMLTILLSMNFRTAYCKVIYMFLKNIYIWAPRR